MRSAVTVSLVPQAAGGPFVFWDDFSRACENAARLGFDGIELFAPGPDAVPTAELERALGASGLKLAAVGTGAGWVVQKLSLTSPDASIRQKAEEFIGSMVEYGGALGASAIIGSMQGRWGDGVSRETALGWLADALSRLAETAAKYNVPLVYEPLNRYETNLLNSVEGATEFLDQRKCHNVVVLAELFHMNIEETDLANSLAKSRHRVGHVHLADSNRRAMGMGHTPMGPIAEALKAINYIGWISAEALPYPDSLGAATKTIETYNKWFA